jgi:hypothetical protein
LASYQIFIIIRMPVKKIIICMPVKEINQKEITWLRQEYILHYAKTGSEMKLDTFTEQLRICYPFRKWKFKGKEYTDINALSKALYETVKKVRFYKRANEKDLEGISNLINLYNGENLVKKLYSIFACDGIIYNGEKYPFTDIEKLKELVKRINRKEKVLEIELTEYGTDIELLEGSPYYARLVLPLNEFFDEVEGRYAYENLDEAIEVFAEDFLIAGFTKVDFQGKTYDWEAFKDVLKRELENRKPIFV